ncbi:hypothetical protein BVI434_1750006 [Burkholderia vietnamiensis]|nr:hypothetical protein BVI434_1750006 [Burkholderia vietnamiensis]
MAPVPASYDVPRPAHRSETDDRPRQYTQAAAGRGLRIVRDGETWAHRPPRMP